MGRSWLLELGFSPVIGKPRRMFPRERYCAPRQQPRADLAFLILP